MRLICSFLCVFTTSLIMMSLVYAEEVFRLNINETGKRDYYCTLIARLENFTQMEINGINGYFVLFRGETAIAEGRAASFTVISPGGVGDTEFVAPNEPCDEIDGYAFRVGACRVDGAFHDREDCAGWFAFDPPIRGVASR